MDPILDSLADDFELEQASETITDALPPEIKLKAERYANLAEILSVIAELRYRNFKLAKQLEKYIEEQYQRLRLQGGPCPEPDPVVYDEYEKEKWHTNCHVCSAVNGFRCVCFSQITGVSED